MKRKTKSRQDAADLQKKVARLSEAYPWKVLSKLSLDLKEYLNPAEYERVEKIARYRDLEAYIQLGEEWGLQSIVSTDRASAQFVGAKYLLASLIKKFCFSTDKDLRIQKATENFLAAEETCYLYNQVRYKALAVPENQWGVDLLHHTRHFLVKLLGDRLPGHRALLDRSRHGPGATIDTDGGDVCNYFKYTNWPYSCTIDALRYARFAIETDPRWLGALQDSYRECFKIPKHYPLDMEKFWSIVIQPVEGNRIAFVPKDARKERTIAIEPTLNLYLQLGVDGFIRRRLKRWGVDLDDQTKNQRLAREGSLDDTEEGYVTIDLSAASDSISLKLCELLLPSEWYRYLCDLRSPNGALGNDPVTAQNFVYEKVSSMGNGFTFALESALFTSLIYGVMKADGERFVREEVAVFGDDLIVKKKYYFKLVEALRLAGFTTNLEKTFSNGPCRESCGCDWLLGIPIRPVFLTEIPRTLTERFCDFNRVKRILSLRFELGEESSEVLSYIRSLVPDKAQRLIGPLSDEDFDSYMHADRPRRAMYRRSVYKYRRLILMATHRSGKTFLFRKLMHDLRGKPIIPNKWDKKLTGVGSRFTVTRRNALTVGYTYSRTDIWCDAYAEILP